LIAEPRGDESSDEDGVRGNTAMSINSTTSLVGGSSVALLPDEKKVKENDVLVCYICLKIKNFLSCHP